MTAAAVSTAIRVRYAAPRDMEHLLFALEQFSEFFGTEHSLYPDEKTARYLLAALIDDPILTPVWVATDGLAFAGFIAGSLAKHPYNPGIEVLSEMFWWVDPAWRGSRAGLLLLNEFLRYGEDAADWIHFTLEANSPVNERCLTKRGFHLHERAYLREVIR